MEMNVSTGPCPAQPPATAIAPENLINCMIQIDELGDFEFNDYIFIYLHISSALSVMRNLQPACSAAAIIVDSKARMKRESNRQGVILNWTMITFNTEEEGLSQTKYSVKMFKRRNVNMLLLTVMERNK